MHHQLNLSISQLFLLFRSTLLVECMYHERFNSFASSHFGSRGSSTDVSDGTEVGGGHISRSIAQPLVCSWADLTVTPQIA